MVDSYEQRLIKNGGVNNSPLVNMCVAAFKHGVENTLDELHLKQTLANSAKTCKDEQEPFDYENANILQKDFAPKVEAKFKVGDFIVNDYCMGKIVEITNNAYLLDTEQGIPFSCHSTRLWDITKDAKDGDVLCSNQIIILFKQWEDNTDYTFVIAHAGIDVSGKLQITNGHWLINNKSKPATKEQRDILFKKMHEAGYEWDAEHKQLKKLREEDV